MNRARLFDGEAPIRWHHFNTVASLELLRCPVREHTTFYRAYANFEFAMALQATTLATDRIVAANVLPIDLRAQSQELPGLETKYFALSVWNLKRNGNRSSGFG